MIIGFILLSKLIYLHLCFKLQLNKVYFKFLIKIIAGKLWNKFIIISFKFIIWILAF